MAGRARPVSAFHPPLRLPAPRKETNGAENFTTTWDWTSLQRRGGLQSYRALN